MASRPTRAYSRPAEGRPAAEPQRYANRGKALRVKVRFLITLLGLLLPVAHAPAAANSAVTGTRKPELASITRLAVKADIISDAYPSREADELESKVREQAISLISGRAISVVRPSEATQGIPELIYSVTVLHDEQCPNLRALHLRLTLRDKVSLSNRRIRRLDSVFTVWEWWADGGEVQFAAPGDVAPTIEDWVLEATGAFVADVELATVRGGK